MLSEFESYHLFNIVDCPDLSEEHEGIVTARAADSGYRWCRVGRGGGHWLLDHLVPRGRPFTPDASLDGPDSPTLSGVRITTMIYEDGMSEVVHDDWMVDNPVRVPSLNAWTGTSVIIAIVPEAKPGPPASLNMGGAEDFVSSRPWMGVSPPASMFAGDDVFGRNKDGVWCRWGTKTWLYHVSRYGERCARPKKSVSTEGSDDDETRRPQAVSPYRWWKMLNTAQRKQWWADHKEGKRKSSSSDAPIAASCPMGLHSLVAGSLAVDSVRWDTANPVVPCASTCYNSGHEGITSNESDLVDGSD